MVGHPKGRILAELLDGFDDGDNGTQGSDEHLDPKGTEQKDTDDWDGCSNDNLDDFPEFITDVAVMAFGVIPFQLVDQPFPGIVVFIVFHS
jgi:hypothetical protein